MMMVLMCAPLSMDWEEADFVNEEIGAWYKAQEPEANDER